MNQRNIIIVVDHYVSRNSDLLSKYSLAVDAQNVSIVYTLTFYP